MWGTQVPVDLTFVNQSPRPVTVAAVEATCSCAVFEGDLYVGKTVAPGQELIVETLFDVETNPGRKAAAVKLTSGTGQSYSGTIVANVLGTWSVSPGTVDLGRIVLDDPEAAASQVVVYESLEDELTDVDLGEVDWIETHLAPRGDAITEILLRVKRERLPPGLSTASPIIRTTNSIKPASVVYVRAKGVYSLVAEPDHVTLVGQQPQVITFKDESGASARLTRCAVEDPSLAAEILEGGKLRIANPTGAVKNGLVTVTVSDERGRERRIVVSTF